MTISTEATYENDLTAAKNNVVSRLADFISGTGDQSDDAINDALNNEWFDGIEVSKWADAVVTRFGG
ncbi:hypothetical protein ACLEIY_16070 [Acetobacter tropicalis]|uniref:hypothetical protein n=1 Tax=Acetobacter tropicalis TaxID=104102 RepID=UPI003976A9AC